MKRIFALLTVLFASSLFAASYEEIIRSAAESSLDAENAGYEYQAGLISIAQDELKDRTDYEVTVAASPLADSYKEIRITTLDLEVSFPDDETTINAGMPFYTRYDGSSALLMPYASLEHTFDWGRKDDHLKALQSAASRLSVEREYSSALLQIQTDMIGIIKSLLSNEREMLAAAEELRDLKRELENDLELGIISTDSILYLETTLAILRSEDSIAILETEKEALLKSFEELSLMEWSGVEDIPDPVFPPSLDPALSTSLQETNIRASIAEEEYLLEASDQNPKLLTLSGSVDTSIPVGQSRSGYDKSVSLEGGIGWESRDWIVEAYGGGSWNRNLEFTPSLTILGTWRSNSTSELDDLVLRSLQNEAILRRSEYLDARRTFDENERSLSSRLLSWRRDNAELEAEIRYRTALLDATKMRLERGLATEEDVHDAELELELLQLDLDISKIDGLLLAADMEKQLL